MFLWRRAEGRITSSCSWPSCAARASGSDDALRLIPISKLSLEGCLEFLAQDELLEVTPENLRIRKQILNHEQRMKAKSKMK